jgi:hypothetical protein
MPRHLEGQAVPRPMKSFLQAGIFANTEYLPPASAIARTAQTILTLFLVISFHWFYHLKGE